MVRKSYITKIVLTMVILTTGFVGRTQIYPVQTNISTSGPYYNYLSYYADENHHLQAVVTLTDFNSGPVQARLRIRIEGPGYELYTNPNLVIGTAFTLDPGVPQFLNGFDLAPYLQEQNLVVSPSGIDVDALPEGFTTICIDVIRDGTSQEVLSTNNCTSFYLQRFQPPQAIFPVCESNISTDEMFYNFQWTPPVGYVPSIGTELNYKFSLYEWNDPNNFNIFQSGQGLVHVAQTNLPQVQLSQFDVVLQEGKQYVWRVEAQIFSSGLQLDMIENNGLSEPCSFTYGESLSLEDLLTEGLIINIDANGEGERKGKAYWTVIDNTPGEGLSTFDSYIVEYRKKPTGNEGFELTWFEDTVYSFNHFMYQLEPSTTYEVKVSGVVGNFRSEPTDIAEFTTNDPRQYACGDQDLPYLLPNYTPLDNALAGMYFEIGQFTMQVTEITPTGLPGRYKGKGLIPIAFLAGAKAKVKFENILVDDQFVIREGEVDVITDGLENWLHQQYMQFIDPIYIDGTIDSAYVENGSAWVIVDGQPLEFEFDPPDYPIVLNDENGVQYTIWPDGTIVIGTYLNISDDTLSVGADSVAVFSQSASETYGFDAKEHMQWHQNYEVILLSDSSHYFVPNKSVGEGNVDKVNVLVPAAFSNPTFEIGGSVLTSNPISGGMSEVTIPANLSKGNHELYVKSGSLKIGKLNVSVYDKKEKELVIVPLVSSAIDTVAISAAVKETLGEANVDVSIELMPQWNNPIFTDSKSIQLPIDVGLMNKYSLEMRELRDAFFNENPHLTKHKYYVFVVPSFSDPGVDGYMVRGKGLGFVASGSSGETFAHELGHGIGALEHSWKNGGPDQGTTNNFMDYSVGASEMTKRQWKELRDLDIAPSVFDSEEDNMFGAISTTADWDDFDPVVISSQQVITQGSIPPEEVLRLPSGTFVQFPQGVRSKFTHFVLNNGFLVALKNDNTVLSLVESGYLVKEVIGNSSIDYNSDQKVSIVAFMCDSASCPRTHSTVAYENQLYTTVNYVADDVQGSELYFPECLEFDGVYCTGFSAGNPVYSTYPCPPEAGGCPGSTRSMYSQAEKEAVYNSFNTIVSSGSSGWTNYNAIEFTNGNVVLGNNARAVIEEKIRVLRKYRPNIYVGVVSLKLDSGPIMDATTVKELANKVTDSLAISHPNKSLILFLNVVKQGTQNSGLWETHYSCRTSGYGTSDVSLIKSGFMSEDIGSADVKKAFLTLFSKIKKPYYITNIYERHDGSKVIKVIDKTNDPGSDVWGFPFIHGANHLVSEKKGTYDAFKADLDEIIADYEFQELASQGGVNSDDYVNDPNYQLKLSLFEQWAELAEEDRLDDPTKWERGEVEFENLRERYLDESLAIAEYGKEKSGEQFLINTTLAMYGSLGELAAYKYYEFDVMKDVIDPMVYSGLDVLGFVPGMDFLADAVGMFYATVRGDGQSFVLYGAALTMPFVGGGTLHGGQKLYAYYAKKNAVGEIDIFVKSLDDDLDGLVKISNDIPYNNSNATSIKNHLTSKIDEFDDVIVKKVVALKGGASQVDDLASAWKGTWTKEQVLAIPKPNRPAPSTYLNQSYIDNHVAQFNQEGTASRIVFKDDYLEFGVGKPDVGKTEFVAPKSEIDQILNLPIDQKAAKLGIPIDQLQNGELVRIDFTLNNSNSIFMPTGNEFGANINWLPGGKTSGGVSEAVIQTEGMQLNVDYIVTDI